MSLTESLQSYIEQAAANTPAPGGGSVSALAAALGSCMASMAGNFTVGKKKFAAVEGEVRSILAALAQGRQELLDCMAEDATAFTAVGKAYKLPKNTAAEKEERRQAIQESLSKAMEVPLRTMRSALNCLETLPRLAETGNPNLISDTGVAAILLEAAIRAARLNVLINLASLTDPALVADKQAEVTSLISRADELCRKTLHTVEDTITR